MKPLRFILTSLLICAASGIIHAQEKYSKVKISIPDDINIRSEIIGLLQIDHFETDAKGAIISEISSADLSLLKTMPYKYQVLVDDVSKHLDSLNAIYFAAQQNERQRVAFEQQGNTLSNIIQTPAAFEVKSTLGGYYSFPQMEAAMNSFVASYPSIAQKFSIGKTDGNRDIWVIKISDNVALEEPGEPEILYQGLQHAREAITGASMIFFMQYLGENYATDNRIKDLVDNRVIYIIPCMNPDGWEYNRSTNPGGGGMWRKNRGTDSTLVITSTGGGPNRSYDTTFQSSFVTVDLNRNWGVDWANCGAPIKGNAGSCGSGTTTSDTYWGASAFSEKETQAVRNFALSRKLAIAFDQHAYGPYYSLPYGRQSLHGQLTGKAAQFFTAIPALAGKYNGMRAADSYDALGYEVAGGFKDWMLTGELGVANKDTIWAMTGEGGGNGTFWPAASNIITLAKGMCYQNIQLAYAAGTYVDVQDIDGVAVNNLSGTLTARIKRLGVGNDAVKVSLIPFENILNTGDPVIINSMEYYAETPVGISYTIPGSMTPGQRMKFIWQVETNGYTYADTITKYYSPTLLFSDDMETGSVTGKWTVSGGWAYSTDDAFSGARSLTESPGGNYSGGQTLVATNSEVFNLTGSTAAVLTFITRHRAENFRDKLQVQVANNAGGTNWVAIPGLTTVAEPGSLDASTLNGQPALTGIRDYWTREVFDLTPYTSSSVRFRFVFTSDNTSGSFKYKEDDGFYIDDIQLFQSSANFIILPNRFLEFTGQLNGQQVVLDWKAETGPGHNYYEVQRSSDGHNFLSIGRVTAQNDRLFIDQKPLFGANHYRLMQMNKDGQFIYSKTILIDKAGNIRVNLYPNPVADDLQVYIQSTQAERFTLQVTDIFGRPIYTKENVFANQAAVVSIPVKSLKPQVYQLRIINKKNETISIRPFIKQ